MRPTPKPENRAIMRTYTIKRKNANFVAQFAAKNYVSISSLINFFIEKILAGDYGDEIIDDACKFSLPKYLKLN